MARATLTAGTVLRDLEKLYEPPRAFLDWKTPLDLLVAVILSAQCTDARVNIVTKVLFQRFRTAKDYAEADRAELEAFIRSCGTYRNKARFIQETCRLLLERHGGNVPETMAELTALPGVGRKTAAIILYAVYGKNEGIAVDTHVLRLARRLGLTRNAAQDKVERDLMASTPRPRWGRLTTLLISHGRAVCTARNRQCGVCVFRDRCPSSLTRGKPDLAKSVPAPKRPKRAQ